MRGPEGLLTDNEELQLDATSMSFAQIFAAQSREPHRGSFIAQGLGHYCKPVLGVLRPKPFDH